MSLDSHLIHTCIIERDPTNGADIRGNAPVDQIPELIYSGPCRLVEKTERIDRERGGGTALTVYKLLVPPCAVQDHDRIRKVVMDDGSELVNAYTVNAVLARKSNHTMFLSLDLERVQ